MCNCEEDFCGVAKYKHKRRKIELVIEYGVVFTIALCIITASVLLINPHYFN